MVLRSARAGARPPVPLTPPAGRSRSRWQDPRAQERPRPLRLRPRSPRLQAAGERQRRKSPGPAPVQAAAAPGPGRVCRGVSASRRNPAVGRAASARRAAFRPARTGGRASRPAGRPAPPTPAAPPQPRVEDLGPPHRREPRSVPRAQANNGLWMPDSRQEFRQPTAPGQCTGGQGDYFPSRPSTRASCWRSAHTDGSSGCSSMTRRSSAAARSKRPRPS
jgi:hypothetical protein